MNIGLSANAWLSKWGTTCGASTLSRYFWPVRLPSRTYKSYLQSRKNNPRQLHPHPQKQLCPKCGCPEMKCFVGAKSYYHIYWSQACPFTHKFDIFTLFRCDVFSFFRSFLNTNICSKTENQPVVKKKTAKSIIHHQICNQKVTQFQNKIEKLNSWY